VKIEGRVLPQDRIKVLLITDLFPRFDGDIRGIFMLDHVQAVSKDLRQHVLNPFMQKVQLKTNYLVEGVELQRVVVISDGSGTIPSALKLLSLLFMALRTAWSAGRFDVIHAHGAIIPGLIGSALSFLRRTPLVVTEHTGPYSRISARPVVRFIAGLTLRRATATIAVSKHLRDEIRTAHGPNLRIEVLHNPVDTGRFLPAPFEREKIMLFVGRLDKEKGMEKMLHAFMVIQARDKGWKINIVGEGPYDEELRSLLNGPFIELRDSVSLSGAKSKVELPLIMNASAFLVHLSSHESFGITIVEALACGIPVLAGRNSAMVETVQENCGILVDTEVDAEIQDGMMKMMETWESYDREQLHDYAERLFGYESFRQNLLRLYRDIVN